MTTLDMPRFEFRFKSQLQAARQSAACVVDDIAHGFFEITHNGFAILGLVVVFAVVTLVARPDLREAGELELMSWLQERQELAAGPVVEEEPEVIELTAVERATAANPKELPTRQAAVAYWLSKKYGVAPEPLSVLVAQAFEIGQKAKLDPTLILAIMAIESGFNPFAQSKVGAQGLMQVMTKIHSDKYENFGGGFAAFDPVTNLRVGVKVLQECISRAGSIEGGLKYYVGAANLADDGGYAGKVLAEHARLTAVMGGKKPEAAAPRVMASPAPAVTAPVQVPAKLTPPAGADKSSDQVATLGQS
jgi:Transglycosylase SLT domain